MGQSSDWILCPNQTILYKYTHTQTPLPQNQGTWASPATTILTVNYPQLLSLITNASQTRSPPLARRSVLWPRLRLVPFSRCVPAARCASAHASRRCSYRLLLLGVLRVCTVVDVRDYQYKRIERVLKGGGPCANSNSTAPLARCLVLRLLI